MGMLGFDSEEKQGLQAENVARLVKMATTV